MNDKTLKLTTGAMFTAIFAVMLLINRQTGGMFQEMILFVLPIPLVGFASKYGFKSALPVMASMVLISVIVSTPAGIFYAVTEAAIGLFLGSGIYAKRSTTKLMLGTMGMSALVNVFDMIVMSALFGYNIFSEIGEMKEMMDQSMAQYGATQEVISAIDQMFESGTMIQLMVISMVLMGLVQGFIVFQLSLLILRRLKFYVPRPKSIFLFYPPMWTLFLAAGVYFAYNFTYNMALSDMTKMTIQLIGLCGYLYMVCFGFVAVMLLVRKFVTRNKIVGFLVGFAGFMFMPLVEMILGAAYLMPGYHKRMLEGLNLEDQPQNDRAQNGRAQNEYPLNDQPQNRWQSGMYNNTDDRMYDGRDVRMDDSTDDKWQNR